MTNGTNNLVCIGEARNSVEASLIKTFLNDNGIFCYIQGEGHRSQLGVIGQYIALNVHVKSDQAKEASVLLNQIFDQRSKTLEERDNPVSSDIVDEHAPRKKRIGVVLLLTFCVTFGTAHLYVGAFGRFLCLACFETIGVFLILGKVEKGISVGIILIICAVVLDCVGAVTIIFKKKKAIK